MTVGMRPLTQAEIDVLDMCFLKERTRALFKVCLYTGLRPKEALSLRVADIQGGRVLLWKRNSKGRVASRSLKLHPALASYLATYTQGASLGDPLFAARDGKVYSYHMAYRELKAALSRAQIKGRVALHSGRKTFAERVWLASGKDLIATSRLLGHTNPQNTLHYIQPQQGALDALVEAAPWPGLR